jgi:hypothetical protein
MFFNEQPTFRTHVSPVRLAVEAIGAALFLGSLAACIA